MWRGWAERSVTGLATSPGVVPAFILYKEGIIGADEEMNALILPRVGMPHRDGFFPDDRPDSFRLRLSGDPPPAGQRRPTRKSVLPGRKVGAMGEIFFRELIFCYMVVNRLG